MQTKIASFIESVTNTGSAFFISLVASFFIYPFYGANFATHEYVEITLLFTLLSVARNYFWRRVFTRELWRDVISFFRRAFRRASLRDFVVIGISGRAGSGKDTVANELVRNAGLVRYGMADPIKAMLDVFYAALGKTTHWEDREWKEAVDPELGFSPRRAAQLLGTEWGRTLNPLIWIKCADAFIWKARERGERGVVIPDIRYDNEGWHIRLINRIAGFYAALVHLDRPGVEVVAAHASEAGFARHPREKVIVNDGTLDDLKRNARALLVEAE